MGDFGLLVAQYNSSLPTLTNGDLTELQVDVNGRLLVQADVSVVIDFLGLNGAADSSNILIVGTEDGTDTGTAHAVRLTSNGSVVIRDLAFASDSVTAHQGGTWTIDSITNDVNVTATDLDIRPLTSSEDAVQVEGSNGNSIEPNADGSINAVPAPLGTEDYTATDALADAGDGLQAISTTFAAVASVAIAAGSTAYLYGWSASADKNATAKIVITDGALVKVYKLAQLTSAVPNFSEHWNEGGRIEIPFAAAGTIEVEMKTKRGSGQGFASLHVREEV